MKTFNFFLVVLPWFSLVFAAITFAQEENCQNHLARADQLFANQPAQRQIEPIIRQLARLRIRIDHEKIQGHKSLLFSRLIQDYRQKENELIHLIQYQSLTHAQIIERIMSEIEMVQLQDQALSRQTETARSNQRLQVKEIDGSQAIFQRIGDGSFKWMGTEIEVPMPQPFFMMATPVTQIIWKRVLNLTDPNSPVFPGRESEMLDPFFHKGNLLPAENISYEDIESWILALNTLSEKENPALLEIIPDHKKGDFYRLPTESDWEFVLSKIGPFEPIFGNDMARLKLYAWIEENSGGRTHPVAEKLPLMIGELEFYDMFGNVFEFVYGTFDRIHGGSDPTTSPRGYYRVHRGGSYKSPLNQFDTKGPDLASRLLFNPFVERKKYMGFRLVRVTPLPSTQFNANHLQPVFETLNSIGGPTHLLGEGLPK